MNQKNLCVNELTQYLTDKEILEFQKLVLQIHHKKLTFEEAKEQATKLVMAFDLMLENQDIL